MVRRPTIIIAAVGIPFAHPRSECPKGSLSSCPCWSIQLFVGMLKQHGFYLFVGTKKYAEMLVCQIGRQLMNWEKVLPITLLEG